jgi:hypothetical protein
LVPFDVVSTYGDFHHAQLEVAPNEQILDVEAESLQARAGEHCAGGIPPVQFEAALGVI